MLHLPPGTTGEDAYGAVMAIRNYFAYRSHHAREQLRLLLVRGVISLLIGLAFLATCLSLRQLLAASAEPFMTILSEGLLILGWVAMWKPVEIFLYDWWPEIDKGRLFERIAHMEIETQAGGHAAVARWRSAGIKVGGRMTSAGNSLRLVKVGTHDRLGDLCGLHSSPFQCSRGSITIGWPVR